MSTSLSPAYTFGWQTPKHKTARFFVLRALADGAAHWSRGIYQAWIAKGGNRNTLHLARWRMIEAGELAVSKPVYDEVFSKYGRGIKGGGGRYPGRHLGKLCSGAQRRQWQLTEQGRAAAKQLVATYGSGARSESLKTDGRRLPPGIPPPRGFPLAPKPPGGYRFAGSASERGSHPATGRPAEKPATQNRGREGWHIVGGRQRHGYWVYSPRSDFIETPPSGFHAREDAASKPRPMPTYWVEPKWQAFG